MEVAFSSRIDVMQNPTSTASSHHLSLILLYWENPAGILIVLIGQDVGTDLLEEVTLFTYGHGACGLGSHSALQRRMFLAAGQKRTSKDVGTLRESSADQAGAKALRTDIGHR